MKNLIKLCTVMVFISSSIIGFAQSSWSSNTGFEEPIYGPTGTVIGYRLWDTPNDKKICNDFQTGKGWLYGTGEATGNLNETTETYIKREAQDAAIEQLAGQLAKTVQKFHQDVRTKGTRDGLSRDDKTWQDGMKYQIKGDLPQASVQYSYKIKKGDDNIITYVVGIGIDMKSWEQMKKGYQNDDQKKDGENELKDAFNF